MPLVLSSMLIARTIHLTSEWGRQFLQQRLRFLQIARVEPFSEPPVYGSQQFARLLNLALVAPRRARLIAARSSKDFGLLLACDR